MLLRLELNPFAQEETNYFSLGQKDQQANQLEKKHRHSAFLMWIKDGLAEHLQTGKIFRIKGKGASHIRSRGRGDLLCRVIVEIPSILDKKQLKALEEFSKSTDERKNFPGTDQFKKVFKQLD